MNSRLARWWKDVGERLVWTAVQAGGAVVMVALARSGTVSGVRWLDVADVALAAALLAFGKGVAMYGVGEPGTAGSVDLRGQ